MKRLIMLLSILSVSTAFSESTIAPVNSEAYGANIGWVDARADGTNGMIVGEFYCSGYLYSANVGWIHLGDGSPMNGKNYAQNYASDYGVNHDGQGHLTGYAYGANIGWINFEQTYGKPAINLKTGELTGHIWSANMGWIDLNSIRTTSLAPGNDNDFDGIPDAWEYRYVTFGRNALTVLSRNGDKDGDGVSDRDEYLADTNPKDADDQLMITDLALTSFSQKLTWTSKPSRQYNIEYSSDLGTNWIQHTATYPTGTTASQSIKGGPTRDARFYRIIARPPLSN
ncbi:hypothetical protein [Pontiella agarivorans]|uniref:Uncharacterized protein n=1 Tax=Pontiella agarivorans TaxID=3038953 RepID=A0ABU5MXL4_9BACT|nr:hypothetical protein [Pontiella agarivorans]MDZ8118939.1 hypothetical protein [Pontiella agarivorans]